MAASQRALGIDPTRADVIAPQGRLEFLRARCAKDAATRATAARRASEQFERAFAIDPTLRREHGREYAGASGLLGPAPP